MNEEEYNTQSSLVRNVGDLEIVLNTNKFYKKNGNGSSEMSTQYLVVTSKNTTSRSNAPMAHPIRNIANSRSSGRGEKNPPFGKIENSHKMHVRKKRKNLIQEEEENLIENYIQIFSLDDMELEANIEKIFPAMGEPKIVTQQNVLLEVVANEIFSEEESFTFQSLTFDKESKKLIVERGDQKNKRGKYRSEVDLKDMQSSQISKIYQATDDTFDDSIDGLEAENTELKERIRELSSWLVLCQWSVGIGGRPPKSIWIIHTPLVSNGLHCVESPH
jgi:hypothetical protein